MCCGAVQLGNQSKQSRVARLKHTHCSTHISYVHTNLLVRLRVKTVCRARQTALGSVCIRGYATQAWPHITLPYDWLDGALRFEYSSPENGELS